MSHGHTMTAANGEHIVAQHAAPEAAGSHVPVGAHEMPSGNWVQIGNPRVITRGDKKALIAAVRNLDLPVEIGFAVTDALLAKLVTAWSYPLPLPSQDRASLDEIPGVDDEAISELVRPAKELLFPGTVTVDDAADERSPTAPSGE